MEQLKVTQLKALAKECGLKGYSKLRKAELIELINRHVPTTKELVNLPAPPKCKVKGKPKPFTSTILDKAVSLSTPILTPVKAVVSKVIQKGKEKLNDFYDWLVSHTPSKPKP